MRNAPYVPGVPTPYKWQNRAYPTRFHGPNYTRPVFGFPQIAKPYDVFTEGYNIDREVPQSTVSGLGQIVDTGEGVFRPGGYGGGVFDGNISGLGALATKPNKSLGILSSLFSSADATDYPWKSYSEKTKALQQQTNLDLIAKQRCPIAVDGKLGPGTCGAIRYVGKSPPTTCESFTDPPPLTANCAQGGGGAPVVVTTSPLPSSPVLESGMSSSSKRALGFAIGGALAIGAVLVLRKKR